MLLYNLLWVISLQISLNEVSSYGPIPYYGDYNFPPWQGMQPLYEGPPNIPPRFPDQPPHLGAPAPQIIRPIIPERSNNEPVNISHATDVLGVVSKLAPHVKPVVNIQYQGPVNFYNIYKANNGAETRNETTGASESLASLVELLKYVNGQLDRFVPNTTKDEQNSAATLQALNKTIIAVQQLAPATTQPTVHGSEVGGLHSGAGIQKPNNPLYTSEYHEKDPAVTHETQHNLYLSSDIHGTKPFLSNYEVPAEHLFLSGNESDLNKSDDSPPFLSTHKENRATNTFGDELYLSKITEHKTRSARSVKYEDNPNKRWGKLGFLFRKTRQVLDVPANQNSFGLPDLPPTVAPSKLILDSEDFAPSTTTTIDRLLSNLSALPENRENIFRNSGTRTENGLPGIPAQFEQIPASVFRSRHRFAPKTIPDLDNYHLEMLIILNMRYAKIFQALKSDLSIPQEGTLKFFRQNLQNINRDQNFGPNLQNLALPTRNSTIAFKSVGGELLFDALPVRAAASFRTNLKNINRDTNFRENFENFQTPDAKLTPFNRINIISSAPILSTDIQNLGPTTSFNQNFPKIDTIISVGNNFNNSPSNFNENIPNTFQKPETALPNNQNASLLTQMIVNDLRRITNDDLLKLPEKNSSEFNLNQQNVNRDQFLVGDQIFQLPPINFGSNQTQNDVNSLVINSEKNSKNRAPKKLELSENSQAGLGALGVNTLINSVTETNNFENIGQIPLERHPIFDGDKKELTDSFGKPSNF